MKHLPESWVIPVVAEAIEIPVAPVAFVRKVVLFTVQIRSKPVIHFSSQKSAWELQVDFEPFSFLWISCSFYLTDSKDVLLTELFSTIAGSDSRAVSCLKSHFILDLFLNEIYRPSPSSSCEAETFDCGFHRFQARACSEPSGRRRNFQVDRKWRRTRHKRSLLSLHASKSRVLLRDIALNASIVALLKISRHLFSKQDGKIR